MTAAICFKCGSEKTGAFSECRQCGIAPHTENELAVSLVLSDHISDETELTVFSHEIQNHLKLSLSDAIIAGARDAIKDRQLMSMLNMEGKSEQTTAAEYHETPQKIQKTQPASAAGHGRKLETTALHRNPFALLGATTRDDRRKIVELADEKALELDHDVCQKARSDLTNPRTRLTAEMSWLPGVSPRKASHLLNTILHNPMSIRAETGLPPIAQANLMAAAFEAIDPADDPEDIADFIQNLAYVVDELSVDDLVRDINEDRAISGFTEIRGDDVVDAELLERKRYYRNAIKDALNKLPTPSLINALTLAVDAATTNGCEHAPELIDDLVDSYEVEAQEFLQKEAENIRKLTDAARENADKGVHAVEPLITKLELVTRNWDVVAQPIQLSSKARGIDHVPSNEVAYAIRQLAVDLFNQHDMMNQARMITGLLKDLFAELPELSERVEEDENALDEIFVNRKQEQEQHEKWVHDITYSADVGGLYKKRLSISPDGISWADKRYPLESITRVRWGGVRHSTNGVQTGITYTIAFGDGGSEAQVDMNRQDIYSTFIEKLWMAVCVRLLVELLEKLRNGGQVAFSANEKDTVIIKDDLVLVTKHRLFEKDERLGLNWRQVKVWTADGNFYIGSNTDENVYGALSYLTTPNTHILEHAIRMALKKQGMQRLSDVLKD